MGNRSGILMESFLLQARNIRLFIPIFLVVIAYTTLTTFGYSTVVEPVHAIEARIRTGRFVTAWTAYLLITGFMVGPAVVAVTVSAAVTACSGSSERRRSLFYVRKLLVPASSLMNGPICTALLGHVLHAVAWKVIILVFELYTTFYFRDPSSLVLLNMEVAFVLLGNIVALYVEGVCALAVVVSVAEPASSFYGVGSLRQSWGIMANKTRPAVILVLVKGTVKAIMKRIYFRLRFVYSIHFYYTVGYAILPRFVYITLYAALQLWFVCATTVYYYQCRQRKDDSYYCSV